MDKGERTFTFVFLLSIIIVATVSLCFGYIRHYRVGAVCRGILWSSILLGAFNQALLHFYIDINILIYTYIYIHTFRPAKLRQILPQNWHNRSVLFAVTLFGCKIDFVHLRRWLLRPARDRHNFPHMSQLAL